MDPLRLLQRAFDLLRYGNSLAGRSGRRLDDLLRAMLAALGPTPPDQQAAVRALLRRWAAQGTDAFADLRPLLAELQDLARAYRVQAGADVGRTVADTAVNPEVVGLRVDRWLEEQRRGLALRAEAQLRMALAQGEDAGGIAARLEKVIAQRQRETATLLRTAATRTAQAAYESGLRAAGVDRYRYVAVMDTRTTREGGWNNVGCWGANDHVFRFDDPEAPRPGWHWNCRSHIEPVTGEEQPGGFGADIVESLGLDLKAVQAAERELLRAGVEAPRRPSDFAAFVRSQPIGVRIQVLGAQGARRFGVGVSLSTVAQQETGRLTLEELRARL